jgi:ribosomal protein L17
MRSTLIVRGRPRRLPRRLSAADRTTLRQFAHKLAALQRDLETLRRTDQARRDDLLITSSLLAQVGQVQQAYRDVLAVVRGIRSREVPGLLAEDKNILIKLINQIAEEYKDVRILRTTVGDLTSDVRQLARELTQLRVRSFGEDL